MARDWTDWHAAYDDPGSSLSRRLVIVQDLIRLALDSAAAGPIRVLSLCAGDGRDITGAVTHHPRRQDVSGVLIELDDGLAAAARANVAAAQVDLDVWCADAADPTQFADALPVDVLLLAGIFGNVVDSDVEATIAAVPQMCRDGATVIWTRHRRAPDLTPRIRQWFDAVGCEPIAFRSPEADGFAVGSERLVAPRRESALPTSLFTFRDDLW